MLASRAISERNRAGRIRSARTNLFAKAVTSAVLAALITLPGAPAFAQSAHIETADEATNRLFREGTQAFAQGRYDDSLRLLESAWSRGQSADIAANLAVVELKTQHFLGAAIHFRYALKFLLPSTTDEQRQAIAEGLTQAESHLAKVEVQTEPPRAEVRLDGVPIAQSPTTEWVNPGEHTVSAEVPNYRMAQTRLTLGSGEVRIVSLTLEHVQIAVPQSSTHSSDSRTRSMTPAIVAGGFTLIGGIAGIVFELNAHAAEARAIAVGGAFTAGMGKNPCGTATPYGDRCTQLHEANVATDRNHNLALASFIAAGTAAAATVTYLLWPDPSAPVRATVSVTPEAGYATFTTKW